MKSFSTAAAAYWCIITSYSFLSAKALPVNDTTEVSPNESGYDAVPPFDPSSCQRPPKNPWESAPPPPSPYTEPPDFSPGPNEAICNITAFKLYTGSEPSYTYTSTEITILPKTRHRLAWQFNDTVSRTVTLQSRDPDETGAWRSIVLQGGETGNARVEFPDERAVRVVVDVAKRVGSSTFDMLVVLYRWDWRVVSAEVE